MTSLYRVGTSCQRHVNIEYDCKTFRVGGGRGPGVSCRYTCLGVENLPTTVIDPRNSSCVYRVYELLLSD